MKIIDATFLLWMIGMTCLGREAQAAISGRAINTLALSTERNIPGHPIEQTGDAVARQGSRLRVSGYTMNTIDLKTARAVTHFWQLVQVGNKIDCWLWKGGRAPNGYGTFKPYGFAQTGAHRYSWMISRGPIPPGKCVCHRCDVPLCVNPYHLFLASQKANVWDAIRKKRMAPAPSVHPKGEQCRHAKLTEVKVKTIRENYTGAWGELKRLGEKYAVTPTSIARIVNRHCWKHI